LQLSLTAMPIQTLLTASSRRRATALLTSISLSALIVACGGGGGTDTGAPTVQPSATALYFTDDFSAAYDAVWVSISRVTAVNAAGTETQLLAYAPSLRLNLPQLRDAGNWAANAQIPTDTVAIRVYVEPKAQLQKLDGSVLDVTLSTPAGYLSFKLEGWERSSGVLALDFDLPRFTLQGTTLVAATRIAGGDELSRWNHREAEIKGTVTAVSATSLTVDTGLLGTRVFVLDSNTSFVSLASASWQPAVGDSVEVHASVSGQGADVQFTARVVKQRSGSDAAGTRAEVKGKVDAVQGSVVTLTVDTSRNGGPVGTLSIDLANAVFKRGSLTAVQPGVRLEIYLVLQGQTWVAKAVEVEGAAPPKSAADKPRKEYAELKGQVVSLSGSTLVLHPLNTSHFSAGLPAGDVTVDLSKAYFKKSSLSCLSAGTPVALKGYVDAAGVFQVVAVEAEGACAAAVPVAGLKPPAASSDPSVLNGKTVEAKGSVSALRSGEFDLTLYRVTGLNKAPATVVVRYGSDTVFKDLSAAALAAGQFLEVKGVWQDGVITAAKIERD
jgi:hypothetical protein